MVGLNICFENASRSLVSVEVGDEEVENLVKVCSEVFELNPSLRFHVFCVINGQKEKVFDGNRRMFVRTQRSEDVVIHPINFVVVDVQILVDLQISTTFHQIRSQNLHFTPNTYLIVNNATDEPDWYPTVLEQLQSRYTSFRFEETEDVCICNDNGEPCKSPRDINESDKVFVIIERQLSKLAGQHSTPTAAAVEEMIDLSTDEDNIMNVDEQKDEEALLYNDLVLGILLEYGLAVNAQIVQSLVQMCPTKDIHDTLAFYLDNVSLFTEETTHNVTIEDEDVQELSMQLQTDDEDHNSHPLVAESGMSFPSFGIRECKICLDALDQSSAFFVRCNQSEQHCYHPLCIARLVCVALRGGDDSGPYLPACPQANGPDGCRHILRAEEVNQILKLSAQTGSETDGGISLQEYLTLHARSENLFFTKVMREQMCARCPVCPATFDTNAFWAAPPANTYGWSRFGCRVYCPRCEVSFCASCRESPYHSHCRCDQLMQYARAWADWTSGGRETYRQTQQQAFEQAKEQYTEQQKRREIEMAAAQARFKELQDNELWKAKNCRCCPNCHRVIEKLSGCDHMVCGQDSHGGNKQQGCGQSFSWSSAPKYVANTGQAKLPAELDTRPPEEVLQSRHLISPGLFMECDLCHEEIIGPRIQCLHCHSLSLCLRCSTEGDFSVGNDWLPDHHNGHVCIVHMGMSMVDIEKFQQGAVMDDNEVVIDVLDDEDEEKM